MPPRLMGENWFNATPSPDTASSGLVDPATIDK